MVIQSDENSPKLPANKSIAVSSLAEEAIAPALVAPIARDIASAIGKPWPVPSSSTDTKQGKPRPFSYKDRTDEPIILYTGPGLSVWS